MSSPVAESGSKNTVVALFKRHSVLREIPLGFARIALEFHLRIISIGPSYSNLIARGFRITVYYG
jgi:hypothetical protein